ncbi:histone deacetylase family protein [Paludisphaera mucosa]|uniref:Histone deacetylase n=1 Tax=Paludisphaera mucosa TaxID=3030827 RepID=A0ABT6F7W0_9BACT|nr:histone deacetylase [Paludisphaera mucosa]MDG3003661.1 histone deacetylase [Paludisphaera mucosa]
MDVFYTDQFVLPLPATHSFPAAKYALLRRRLIDDGIIPPEWLRVPDRATPEEIVRVHDPAYLARVVEGRLSEREVRELGLPWSPELVERSLRSCGATVAAARSVLAEVSRCDARPDGLCVAMNLAGGTHHAFRDHGAGYCVFNDAAVAARAMQAEGRCRKIVVIDCDVHQGDGTAAIFADDPDVYTFSIHGARNYPLRKQRSRLDVGLDDGTGDEAYLAALEPALGTAIEESEAELAIYLAGSDPFAGDRLGRMKLSREGLAARDRMVFEACREAGLPVATAMAGGYARDVNDTVAIQAETVRIAAGLSAGRSPGLTAG